MKVWLDFHNESFDKTCLCHLSTLKALLKSLKSLKFISGISIDSKKTFALKDSCAKTLLAVSLVRHLPAFDFHLSSEIVDLSYKP